MAISRALLDCSEDVKSKTDGYERKLYETAELSEKDKAELVVDSK